MRFEEIPVFIQGMRQWGARIGGYQFVISYEDGSQLKPEDRAEWVGYRASYQDHNGSQPRTVRLDGSWASFVAAENACKDIWRQLRQKN